MILSGWWKFHRMMKQHAVWSLPDAQFKVWITILTLASYRETDWWDKRTGERVAVPMGSLVRSQQHLALEAKVGRQVVRDALRNLEAMGSVRTQQRTHKGTQAAILIEVINWPIYQGADGNGNPTENPQGNPILRSKEAKKNSSANGLPPGFCAWWAEYPKKVGKIQAVKAWGTLNPDETLQTVMLDAIRKQRQTVKAMVEGDRHHILDPERWLKYRRWEDEVGGPSSGGMRYPEL